MNDTAYMRLAIEEARQSLEPYQCGVVIVKDGEVVGKGYNQQRAAHNATLHAEIQAISRAGTHLGNKNLPGCTIYCTCEPCTMCLSAIVFAKIDRLVYGVSLLDFFGERIIDITTEAFLEKAVTKPEVEGGCLRSECIALTRSTR